MAGIGDWTKLVGGIADIFGGGGSTISSSATDPNNELTYRWMQEANAFNAEQAQINRDWLERMSNTAFQRQMRDLKKAGLNPILSANLGGASTPGSSPAQANFTGAGSSSSSYSSSVRQSALDTITDLGRKIFSEESLSKAGAFIQKIANTASAEMIKAYKQVAEMNSKPETYSAGNHIYFMGQKIYAPNPKVKKEANRLQWNAYINGLDPEYFNYMGY